MSSFLHSYIELPSLRWCIMLGLCCCTPLFSFIRFGTWVTFDYGFTRIDASLSALQFSLDADITIYFLLNELYVALLFSRTHYEFHAWLGFHLARKRRYSWSWPFSRFRIIFEISLQKLFIDYWFWRRQRSGSYLYRLLDAAAATAGLLPPFLYFDTLTRHIAIIYDISLRAFSIPSRRWKSRDYRQRANW